MPEVLMATETKSKPCAKCEERKRKAAEALAALKRKLTHG